jgi:hypothetical protein
MPSSCAVAGVAVSINAVNPMIFFNFGSGLKGAAIFRKAPK